MVLSGFGGFPRNPVFSLTKCLFTGVCLQTGVLPGIGGFGVFCLGGFLQMGPSKNVPYRPLIRTFWEANDRPNEGPILTSLCTPPHGNDIFYPTFALHPEIALFFSQERADKHPFSGILIYWDGLPQSVFHLFFQISPIWIAEPAPETPFWLQALFSTPGR